MADYGQVVYEVFATLAEHEGATMPAWSELTLRQRRVWDQLEQRVFSAAEFFATAEEVETGVARKEAEQVLRG